MIFFDWDSLHATTRDGVARKRTKKDLAIYISVKEID